MYFPILHILLTFWGGVRGGFIHPGLALFVCVVRVALILQARELKSQVTETKARPTSFNSERSSSFAEGDETILSVETDPQIITNTHMLNGKSWIKDITTEHRTQKSTPKDSQET